MSVVTLPPPPRPVPELDADPTSIQDFAGDLLAASAQIDDLGSYVAGDGRIPDWDAAGSRAYQVAIRPVGQRADAMSLALRAVGRRAQEHSSTMGALRGTREALVDRRGDLEARITDLRTQVAAASVADTAELQAESDRLRARGASLEGEIQAWEGEVSREDAAMSRELSRLLTLEQVERRYGGATDPADAGLATRPPPGASREEINAWWNGLTPEQQAAITVASPGALGNLDGVPAADRDAANRIALDRDLADLGALLDAGLITGRELGLLATALATRKALEKLRGRTDPVTGEPVVGQLHTYDPVAFDGDGRVAISVGDVDTADNVAVSVPGFGSDATSIDTQTDRAVDIHHASRLDEGGDNGSVAVLAWIGYDAPDFGGPLAEGLAVADTDLAREGGERLADTVDGLIASRPDDPAHLTVIGHSYGSTTAAMAGTAGVAADDMVLTGSPGAGDADDAGDLSIPDGHTYVISASRDPVTQLGSEGLVDPVGDLGLGRNPAGDDFGADRLQGESVHRAPDGLGSYNPFSDNNRWLDHMGYYEHDTESLHNIAQVVNADYDDLLPAPHREDPWYGPVRDPESHRVPTAPDTDGRP